MTQDTLKDLHSDLRKDELIGKISVFNGISDEARSMLRPLMQPVVIDRFQFMDPI